MQLSVLLFISRLLGAGMSKTAASAPRVVSAPFSAFVAAARDKQVSTAQVDGTAILWQRRPAPEAAGGGKRGSSRAAAAQQAAKASAAPQPESAPSPPVLFYSTRPADAAVPYEALSAGGAAFGAPDKRAGSRALTAVLTVLYLGAVASVLGRGLPRLRLPGTRPPGLGSQAGRRGGRGARGGPSSDRGDPPDVTFADVAGVDEAKEELQELVAVLREPERFAALGARPPAGVLLVGQPGTGKTLLARAVAGEAGVPFFAVSASEFVELYVGMGASRVREIYAKARAAAPSIVFIDEIDAVAKGRADGRMRGLGGNDEREQTLNQLLTELDGFDSGGSERGSALVITLAATNRADVLDDALKRPGRFDRTVSVGLPDRIGRRDILAVHSAARGLPLAADASLDDVAAATPGFSGADLASLVNEAAMQAARTGASSVSAASFEAAVLRTVAGLERKRSILFGAERSCVARHEAGHAIVGAAVADALPVGTQPRAAALSILSRTNGALGWAYSPPPSGEAGERSLLFADELRGRLAVLLGGRAAEEATGGGRVSTGASDDIQRATQLAYRAVAEFGLGSLGPLAVASLGGGGGDGLLGREGGGPTAAAAEQEVAAMLRSALGAAKAVLAANAELLERLGALLEKEERVAGQPLAAMLAEVRPSPQLTAFLKGGGEAGSGGGHVAALGAGGGAAVLVPSRAAVPVDAAA